MLKRKFVRWGDCIEEAIVLKRIPSMVMHFNSGYVPEKPWAMGQSRNILKYYFMILSGYNLLVYYITIRIYKKYLNQKSAF